MRDRESQVKNKNLKAPIPSQETSQSDGGSSTNSNHTKGSLNILQINGAGNSCIAPTETKYKTNILLLTQRRSDPIQPAESQSEPLPGPKEAKEITQLIQKISSLVSARHQTFESKEKLISPRQRSIDQSHGLKNVLI